MPTARELLEQADALMRRNRARDLPPEDIPELTDEVPAAAQETLASAWPRAVAQASPQPSSADDVPELTDAVAYVDAVSIQPLVEEGGEVSRWLEGELGEASITGPAPDSIAVVPPATLRPAPDTAPVEIPPVALDSGAVPLPVVPPLAASAAAPSAAATLAGMAPGPSAQPAVAPTGDYAFEAMLGMPSVAFAPASAEAAFDEELEVSPAPLADRAVSPGVPVPPDELAAPVEVGASGVAAGPADDPARWAALAEEVRMQVLQRIDIFTDTGMQQQLTARLQPIVDRASADLVATINQHVGTLLRAYVAEAIEREIEKWRQEER